MQNSIDVKGANVHNLKNVSVSIPRGKIVAFTGRSGSGKSSLAFDTIYAEGYRKYMESLSADARGLLRQMDKPDVESISGLSPVIAIEQSKSLGSNPRSTLATLTEIADYARIIWSVSTDQRCPKCGGHIARGSVDAGCDRIMSLPQTARVYILAPVDEAKPAAIRERVKSLRQRAWTRVLINGKMLELDAPDDETRLFKTLPAGKTAKLELVVDRFPMSGVSRGRVADSLELALKEGSDKAEALVMDGGKESRIRVSAALACLDCGETFKPLTPQSFSFNHPTGACQTCGGLGRLMLTSPELAVPDTSKSIRAGAIRPWRFGGRNLIITHNKILRQLAEQVPFSLTTPWRDLDESVRNLILFGDKKRIFSLKMGRGRCKTAEIPFQGVLSMCDHLCRITTSETLRARLASFQTSVPCPDCGGARLSARSRNVFVEGLSYDAFCKMNVGECLEFAKKLEKNPKYTPAKDAVFGLRARLEFLEEVGLSYVGLDREAGTLSGGEAQRARLATQLGMELTGVTYVLDEPTIGLHPADNHMLIDALKKLKARGNTVLLVEHDEAAIKASDWIVELGPEAGENGGRLTFNGSLADCLKSNSRTGLYLSHRLCIERPAPQLKPMNGYITVRGARENNLKNITAKFPKGLFTVVCGVSGSGKSTLVNDILAREAARKLNGAKQICGAHAGIDGLEGFKTCVVVDQSPIGKSPRSNPATYTKLFDHLRELYAQCPLSKARGYTAGRFSFNVKGGRCENCKGDGAICLDMQFLGDVFVTCPSCGGKRYNRETLEVKYKDLNIADALNLTVDEALKVFGSFRKVASKLETLKEVGLGYIRLGQASNTLSGGEAQRIKLACELSRRSAGETLYILDEPTTGLNWDDIDRLLKLLFKLRDAGNTIIAIEHQSDFIRNADYLVELGPEGGAGGGRIIFAGAPDELGNADTPTAKFFGKE